MLKLKSILLSLVVVIFSGCANAPHGVTKQDSFPKMYEENPKSILILPAVNNSTAAEATDYYATTIAEPLTQKGFYVLPMTITSELLKQEGIVDGAQLRNTNVSVFSNHFGADAVLFVTINRWDTNYALVSANVTVGIGFELVSTKTAQVLWRYENTVVVDTSGRNNNGGMQGGGLLGAIIATAINTSMQDYVPIARQVNATAMYVMPAGPYHSQHNLDQLSPGVDLIHSSR